MPEFSWYYLENHGKACESMAIHGEAMGKLGKTGEAMGSNGKQGKQWEATGKHGNPWESLGKHGKQGKQGEGMGKLGKTWESLGKHGKAWESLAIHGKKGKPWEGMGKHGNPWEAMGSRGKQWEAGEPWEAGGSHGKHGKQGDYNRIINLFNLIIMAIEIKFSQSYLWLNSWVLANIIQLGTQSFCDRFVNYQIDPCRRLYDQMVLAARSGVANIAEGASRESTSIETKMRLLDVARGSIDELQGDYFNFLLRKRTDIWAIGNPDREALWQTNLDTPNYSQSLLHDAAIHILRQKSKFDPWIENETPEIAANAMLILCWKLNKMLENQLQASLEKFREKGGFSENMTSERIDARKRQALESNAPACPKCGKPMLRRTQMRGQSQGREFWGCSDFPTCTGTRPI